MQAKHVLPPKEVLLMKLRRSLAAIAALVALLLPISGAAASGVPDPPRGTDAVDSPIEAAEALDEQHGGPGGHLPASSANVDLVGKVKLTNVAGGISDVGTFGNYAYLGAFSPECAGRPGAQGTGVHIVDISDAANPAKVGFIPAHPNSFVGEGVQVIHMDTASFTGDVLVHNNESCDAAQPFEGGISIWDVTDPLNPVKLAGGVGDNTPAISPNINGVHSVHSTFAWFVPATGRAFAMMADNQEVADVDIIEITDPSNPVMVSETGFNDWPAAQSPLANGDTVFNHDFQIKRIGTKWLALVSYWDAGWVILDVTDPATPVFQNDTDYPTPDPLTGFDIPEGNGHQAWWSSNNQFFLGTDEDFSPTRTSCEIETGPNGGPTPCGEFGFTPDISSLFPAGFSGTTVWGGSGCNEDVDGNGTGDRAEVLAGHTKAQTGADAIVFTRGVCFFSDKIHTGELAGYTMVFIGQSHAGSRLGLLPDGFICGGQGSPIDGTAAAGCIGHRAMHNLFNDTPEY
ncbi:MAG: LVIVD repeat-containing protein, partial [Actinomycetota bacterium]